MSQGQGHTTSLSGMGSPSGVHLAYVEVDPAPDWPAVVVALQAEIEIVGPNSRRRVAARNFFIDTFSTVLEPDEILVSVYIPRPRTGMRFIYRKIRHPASGCAVVGVAVGVRLREGAVDEISIGVTGAANHAFAGQRASDFLIGKTFRRTTSTKRQNCWVRPPSASPTATLRRNTARI